MRILLLNQTFHPDVASTAQHSYDLARSLVDAGHEVSAIASTSLYGGKGAQLPRRDCVNGIEVYRVGGSMFGKGSILLRTVDFCFFWASAAARVLTIPRPDVVIALTTPPFIAALAWLVKLLRGSAFVYWVMDLYPDLPIACGVLSSRSPLARVLECAHRFCLRRADRVVVLGRCMEERVRSKGVPSARIARIPVWSVEEGAASDSTRPNYYRAKWGFGEELVVMYSGNLGLGHDVDTICWAMLRLRDRRSVRFVFVGGGKRRPEVERFAAGHKLPNVTFYPYQPREHLGDLLAAGDVHLVSLLDPVWGIMVPSKVYGIMAAGRPAVFVGPSQSEVSRVLEESGGGVSVRCGDVDALVGHIERLAAHRFTTREMGARGRCAIDERYSRERSCDAWESLVVGLPPNRAAEGSNLRETA